MTLQNMPERKELHEALREATAALGRAAEVASVLSSGATQGKYSDTRFAIFVEEARALQLLVQAMQSRFTQLNLDELTFVADGGRT